MFLTAAFLAASLHAPAPQAGEDGLHEVFVLELEPRIDGAVSEAVEIETDYRGTMYVWVRSPGFAVVLRFEQLSGALLAEARTGRGGFPAFGQLDVHPGAALRLVVTTEERRAVGPVELHVVASHETDRTLAAAKRAHAALADIDRSIDRAGALDLLDRILAELAATEGADESRAAAKAAWAVGQRAGDLEAFEQASEAWSRALQYRERVLPAEHDDVLLAMGSVGLARSRLGDKQGALALEERVFAVRRRLLLPQDSKLGVAQFNLALTRLGAGDPLGARELLVELLPIWELSHAREHADLLLLRTNLAVALNDLGEFGEALALMEEVYEVRARALAPNDPVLIHTASKLASARNSAGDPAGARALSSEVLAVLEATRAADDPDLLDAKVSLAVTTSDLEEARALLKDVLEIQQRRLEPDDPLLLTTKVQLASNRHGRGDRIGALELQEEVVALQSRALAPDYPDLLENKRALGIMRSELGRPEQALALLEEVHTALERRADPNPTKLLRTKRSLAKVMEDLGDLAGARVLHEDACAAYADRLPPEHPELLHARFLLAGTLLGLGHVGQARAIFEEVLAIRERELVPEDLLLLAARANVANARASVGDLAGALEEERAVLEILERVRPDEDFELLIMKLNLTWTLTKLGDLEEARRLQTEVLDLFRDTLAPSHPQRLRATMGLVRTSLRLEDAKAARSLALELFSGLVARAASLRAAAPRFARECVREELDRLFDSEILGAMDAALDSELFSAVENLRDVSVSSSDVALALRTRPDLAEMRRTIADRRAQIQAMTRADLGDVEDIGRWRSDLQRLFRDRDRLEGEVRAALAEDGLLSRSIDAESVAAVLAPGEIAVSFLRCSAPRFAGKNARDELLAFVVRPDAGLRRVELGFADEIEEMVSAWRHEIGEPVGGRGVSVITEGESRLSVPGKKLGSRLLDVLLSELDDVRVMYVVPDDFLYLVPFDALPFEGGRVGDRIAVRNELSFGRLVRRRTRVAREPSMLLAGAIDYGDVASDPKFVPLPETEAEIRVIAALFESEFDREAVTLSGLDCRKETLGPLAAGASYLHLATHGWFAPESFRSKLDHQAGAERRVLLMRAEEDVRGFAPETLCGLALSNANGGANALGDVRGILTAEELATLDLTRCELVVLSACETNVGLRRAGQGIHSLQTALHAAGARAAITSLWQVADAPTRRLMVLFYTKLWTDGLGTADALWQAKSVLRAEGHPLRDWAGWVLSGDPE